MAGVMFRNLVVYRATSANGVPWAMDLAQAEAALQAARFVPCSATQPLSAGWVAPRRLPAGRAATVGVGAAAAENPHGALIESVAGQWLLRLMVERKLLPGAVVRRRLQELLRQAEAASGRKPGKRLARELKDEAVQSLLPQAFTQQVEVSVWIDRAAGLVMIDAASPKRADDAASLLVQALPGLSLRLLQTQTAPATAMAAWLAQAEPPVGFSVDRDCELRSTDEMKSVVRYSRHALDTDAVRAHVQVAGMQPAKLALTWRGRLSFVLTDGLQLKRLAVDDGVAELLRPAEGEDGFDADVALATGELSQLLPELIAALDGELPVAA